jgi:two-component system, cell cycle response regulator DivK
MKKVLIADDYPDMRELLGKQLERLGFLPILAENGKEVLEKAIAEQPRLILMDMMMPVMNGWEAVRSLRANPETKNIPILAATALFHDSDLQRLHRWGLQWLHQQAVHPFRAQEQGR